MRRLNGSISRFAAALSCAALAFAFSLASYGQVNVMSDRQGLSVIQYNVTYPLSVKYNGVYYNGNLWDGYDISVEPGEDFRAAWYTLPANVTGDADAVPDKCTVLLGKGNVLPWSQAANAKTAGGYFYNNKLICLKLQPIFSVSVSASPDDTAATASLSVSGDPDYVAGGKIAEGATCTLSASPVSGSGYSFAHWRRAGVQVSNRNPYVFSVSNDTAGAYVAFCTGNVYQVTLDFQGGSDGTDAVYPNYMSPMPASVTPPRKAGYSFGGYWTEQGGKGELYYGADGRSTGKSWTIKGGGTLYAQWTGHAYQIGYDLDGGTAGGDQPSAGTFDVPFCVSAPTRTGYSFLGWSVASGLDYTTAKWGVNSNPTTSIESAKTLCRNGEDGDVWFKGLTGEAGAEVRLKANWQGRTYRVTFNEMAHDDIKTHGTYELMVTFGEKPGSIQTPSRDWYGFGGYYYTDDQGQRTQLWNPDGQWLGGNWEIPKDVTVVAEWLPYDVLVKFDVNGGSGEYAPIEKDIGGSVILPDGAAYARDGFKFGGWALIADATSPRFSAGQTVVLADYKDYIVGKELTFYAFWIDKKRMVHFNGNAPKGCTVTPSTNEYAAVSGKPLGEDFSKITAVCVGNRYVFTGWFDAAEGGDEYKADSIVPDGQDPLELYAHWQASKYYIAFDGNGASNEVEMAVQELEFDRAERLNPNEYGRKGYTFKGWAESKTAVKATLADRAVVSNFLATAANETNTIYAVWETNTYTVTFEANGGSGSMGPQPFVYDQPQNLNSNEFTRTGFWRFGCWRDTATGLTYTNHESVVNLTAEPNGQVVLQAVWESTLGPLAKAMHCDNLEWDNKEPSDKHSEHRWEVRTGEKCGHETDSCVCYGIEINTQYGYVLTSSALDADGELSFWWKGNIPGGVLFFWDDDQNGDAPIPLPISGKAIELDVVDTEWHQFSTNVVTHGEKRFAHCYYMGPVGSGCSIDGMTWRTGGAQPEPAKITGMSVSPDGKTFNISFTTKAEFDYNLMTNAELSVEGWGVKETLQGNGGDKTFEPEIDDAFNRLFYRIETIQRK